MKDLSISIMEADRVVQRAVQASNEEIMNQSNGKREEEKE